MQNLNLTFVDTWYIHTDKGNVEISQNFVAFSEYMNFKQFMCSRKATKIDGEDFVNFRGLLRKYELYGNPI